MKKHALFVTLLFSFISFSNFAQEDINQEDTHSLQGQMNQVFEKSNSYQNYKVIEKVKLNALRQNILDSISGLQSTIVNLQQDVNARRKSIDSLNTELTVVTEDLAQSQERENGIRVLGMLTSKTTYNAIVWSIILILLLVGAFFFYRFSTSHGIIREANQKVEELETENENLRRTHLEREQKLRRQLQDEINKNKNI